MSLPTWPTKTIMGVESCVAVCMPIAALVAPGPRVTNAEPRAAGQLATGLRHVRSAAFLPADDEAEALAHVVHRIEDGKVAFAGNAECEVRALCEQAGDEDFAARTGVMAGIGEG